MRNIFQCGITTTAVNIAGKSNRFKLKLQVSEIEKLSDIFKLAYLTGDVTSLSFHIILLGVKKRLASKFG